MTALFDKVPVVLIHKDNIESYWSSIISAIKRSSYLAIDLEMTGLGDRKLLMTKDADLRYSHMKYVAETRSVLSMGLACFQKQQIDDNRLDCEFSVETYNIILMCNEEYIVEPLSLRFLVSHGFDFNQQYAKGIHYHRGNDQVDVTVDRYRFRELFEEIVRSKVPVALHNALVDLVFLYQNFYCQLPAKMDTFLADLSEIFAGGIVDTKYISDYLIRWPASYLEYTFRRCQMENRTHLIDGESHVTVTFPTYDSACTDVEYRVCGLPVDGDASDKKPCDNYSAHGNCPLGDGCPYSHDIDVILAVELRDGIEYLEPRNKRKRRRQQEQRLDTNDRQHGAGDAKTHEGLKNDAENRSNGHTVHTDARGTSTSSLSSHPNDVTMSDVTPNVEANVSCTRCEGHRAGFDAFMTGFILAHVLSSQNLLRGGRTIEFTSLPNVVNNVYMCGKDIPLQVRKGAFSKTSKNHNEKMQKLAMS